MSPNSSVAAAIYTRGSVADMTVVALGGNFVQRSIRNANTPSNWVGDTDNAVQDSFAEVTKTTPTATSGSMVAIFSMKPSV